MRFQPVKCNIMQITRERCWWEAGTLCRQARTVFFCVCTCGEVGGGGGGQEVKNSNFTLFLAGEGGGGGGGCYFYLFIFLLLLLLFFFFFFFFFWFWPFAAGTIFGAMVSKLTIFRCNKILRIFGSIVRIGFRTVCWTDSCFYLVLTAQFLLYISSMPLK